TSLFWLGVLAAAGSMGSATLFVLIMAVAVLGFLIFNARHPWRSRASVFLGDAGSMVLGFALAWFAAKISQNVAMVISPVSLAWILALPVVDTVSLMVRRIGKGRSPLAPDREHLHHVFRRAGFSSGATTLLLITLNLILGAVGVFGAMLGVPDTLLFIGFLLLFPCHYYFVRHAWKSARMLRNLQQPTVSERAYSDDA
ncbi:MAG: MraY family glycosyltransferase, partial [Aquisalimonadaceae bacterium]